MLQCQPDISCFAKLMTGGLIPLAATLASEDIFQVFDGDSKVIPRNLFKLRNQKFWKYTPIFFLFAQLSLKVILVIIHCRDHLLTLRCLSFLMCFYLMKIRKLIYTLLLQLKALLHGHSYSAHAMGCAAAVKSVKWFKDSKTNMNLISESRSLQEVGVNFFDEGYAFNLI